MSENDQNGEFKVEVDKEELKNQTKETVNQVKETVKNIDFKKDASATKGFVLELISKPFSTIESIVTEKQNRFSSAVILVIVYMIATFVDYLVTIMCDEYSKFNFMTAVSSIIAPVLFVLAFTIATYLFGGKEKKNITTIISGIAIATTPKIISEVLSMIYTIFVEKLSITFLEYLISICQSALIFISTALMFTAIKNLITKEDEDKIFRKVAVIVVVAYTILKVCSIVGIY